MKDGETKRFDCEECSVEFEVTLEPKVKGKSKEGGIDDNEVTFCPFCGASIDEETETD